MAPFKTLRASLNLWTLCYLTENRTRWLQEESRRAPARRLRATDPRAEVATRLSLLHSAPSPQKLSPSLTQLAEALVCTAASTVPAPTPARP